MKKKNPRKVTSKDNLLLFTCGGCEGTAIVVDQGEFPFPVGWTEKLIPSLMKTKISNWYCSYCEPNM